MDNKIKGNPYGKMMACESQKCNEEYSNSFNSEGDGSVVWSQEGIKLSLLKRLMTLSELKDMKTIEVVAAIIIRNGEVFATQRGYGEFKGWWEFPGGKIESGECPKEALKREIREELDAEIAVGDLLETVEWDYPNFHLTMHCFICSLLSESMHLNEHEAATWLNLENLRSVNWLPADVILLDRIAEYLR